mmetsp:Transcript_10769/g.19651  ORF Transcript_10769/g.19651 Transcript_10769/m.19651 type:complete len:80 (+) Transcript_10769:310-549(+)
MCCGGAVGPVALVAHSIGIRIRNAPHANYYSHAYAYNQYPNSISMSTALGETTIPPSVTGTRAPHNDSIKTATVTAYQC